MRDYTKGISSIPKNIKYHKDLSYISRFIFSDIINFDDVGECFASNQYFALLYNCDVRTVERALKELRECGYIESNYNRTEHKRILKPTDKWFKEYNEINTTDKHLERLEKMEKARNSIDYTKDEKYKTVEISNLKKIWKGE